MALDQGADAFASVEKVAALVRPGTECLALLLQGCDVSSLRAQARPKEV
jgi:hypothetical protein